MSRARFLIDIGISFFAVGCYRAFCCIVIRTTEHQQHLHVWGGTNGFHAPSL